jgi:hypothetical protein
LNLYRSRRVGRVRNPSAIIFTILGGKRGRKRAKEGENTTDILRLMKEREKKRIHKRALPLFSNALKNNKRVKNYSAIS